jgi:hypothetical protein
VTLATNNGGGDPTTSSPSSSCCASIEWDMVGSVSPPLISSRDRDLTRCMQFRGAPGEGG